MFFFLEETSKLVLRRKFTAMNGNVNLKYWKKPGNLEGIMGDERWR